MRTRMKLKLEVPEGELWDNEKGEFVTVKKQTLVLVHSLVSVSEWEQRWKKAFLSNSERSFEELKDYIRCMTINEVDDRVYDVLTPQMIEEVENYISDPMTATTFNSLRQGSNGRPEIITSEIIYYYMFTCGIPLELEKWHLNRLIALIRIFSIKNDTSKMSRTEAGRMQRAIAESRRKGKR